MCETDKQIAWDSGKEALKLADGYCNPSPPDGTLLAVAYERGDYAEEEVWAIFKSEEKYLVFIAQCDTSGFDCQNSSSLETYDSAGKAVAAIDDRARPYLAWAHEVKQ